jgi:hypothetical protein
MDDRAKRDDTRSASESDRANRSDASAERPKTADRAKQTAPNRNEAGKTTAKESAETAENTSETVADDRGVSDDNVASRTGETVVEAAGIDEAEVSASVNDLADEMILADEAAVQAMDLPPMAPGQSDEAKPDTSGTKDAPDAAAQSRKSADLGRAQAGISGPDTGKTGHLTLEEAAPESMTDGSKAASVPASQSQATSANQPTAALQKVDLANAKGKPAAGVDLDQASATEPGSNDRSQRVSTSNATSLPQQGVGGRAAEMRVTAASQQTSGAGDASLADSTQVDDIADDILTDRTGREATGKAASAGEVLAAVAGQSRSATATESGRRAEGRVRESRETEVVLSGNAKAATARSAAATAQISAVQQAFNAQMLGGDAAKAGGQGMEAQILSSDLTPDLPGLSQLLTEAALQPGTVHRPETPRLVAVQLAEAFVTKGERNVDVALNPEELGRVKMRVSTSEAGITVVIQTERAETGDLMRKHINELAEEFRKMGFENVSFQFNGGGASGGQTSGEGEGQSGGAAARSGESEDLTAAEIAEIQVQHLRLGNAGVDMRV